MADVSKKTDHGTQWQLLLDRMKGLSKVEMKAKSIQALEAVAVVRVFLIKAAEVAYNDILAHELQSEVTTVMTNRMSQMYDMLRATCKRKGSSKVLHFFLRHFATTYGRNNLIELARSKKLHWLQPDTPNEVPSVILILYTCGHLFFTFVLASIVYHKFTYFKLPLHTLLC